MSTMTSPSPSFLSSLVDNLAQAVSDAERRKAEENTDAGMAPRHAEHARAIRKTIVEWLEANGPATAAEVAQHFRFHYTTAHSYLNRLVHDGQAKIAKRNRCRVFVAEESCTD